MTDLFGDSAPPALALARKWRPRAFADLKGQEHVVQALSNALTQGRLHHAYLLTGTRGVGKTTLARILAKCLNCETGVTAMPCGVCSACTQIDGGRFVDLLELDAASNTGVDNMREVLDNAQYAPTVGRYKIYIIDEVHMLSKSAFNSMLKTLEEPPAHVKFVLATTDPQKIPVTVLSRCLQFNLKPMPPALVAQHLSEVLAAEKVGYEPAALHQLARAAAGSMRDALSLTDQAIAYGAGRIEAAAVDAMLGTVRRDYLFDLLAALAAHDGDALLDQARGLAERGIALDAALQDMASVLALLHGAPAALAPDTPDFACLQQLVTLIDAESVQLYYQIALNGRRDLPYAPDELAGFSMSLLRMLAFAPATPQALQSRQPPQALPSPSSSVVASATPEPSPTYAKPAEPEPLIVAESPPTGTWDWLDVVARLKLGGMAKMLADHCELVSHEGDQVLLRVGDAHKHLLDRTYQDKLVATLRERYGATLQVKFEIGDAATQTPQQVRTRARDARQADAVAAIDADPLVRELVESFDAKVAEATILPIVNE
jgi:DNA polymerase-3 subunit gamma/tau